MDTKDASIDIASLIDQARKAQSFGHWVDALRCWEMVRKSAPDRAAAFIGLGEALCELGRLDEADAILVEGTRRFPDHLPISTNAAELAQRRGDHEAAYARWKLVRERFPDRPAILAQIGTAFSAMGRFDEADSLLSEATKKFRKSQAVAVSHALTAQHRGDAAEALKRWQSVRIRFPEEPLAQAGIELAQRELSTQEMPKSANAGPDTPPLVAIEPALPQPRIATLELPLGEGKILTAPPSTVAPAAATDGQTARKVSMDDDKARDADVRRVAALPSVMPKRWDSLGLKTAQLAQRVPVRVAPSLGTVDRVMHAVRGLFGRNASR